MSKLILITGDLASGKTRFSEILGAKYSIPVVHKDSIKEILGDTVGFKDREENRKLSEASRQMMAWFFREYSISKSNLIMESNFRKEEVQKLTEMAEKSGYKTLVIQLYGDVCVLHKRYVNRITQENRHPVHQSTTFDLFEDFRQYVESTRFDFQGNVIKLDASDFKYQTDPEVLCAIDSFMTVE